MTKTKLKSKNKNMCILPYKPTKLWRKTLHKELRRHRFSVIVAHRRFGKSVGMVNQLIQQAIECPLRSPVFCYMAPFKNQAKKIVWNYLRYYTAKIPGVNPNHTDLYVELPTKYKNADGARIYVAGADKPDNIRGTYFDGVVMDEPAQMKPNVFGEIIRPAILDRHGWVVWIGTPKGQNRFYEIWQRAVKDERWYAAMFRADETGLFDEGGRYGPEELELMKEDMTEAEFAQEMLCDFNASSEDILIPIGLVTIGAQKELNKEDIEGAPVILGVDVARFGGDRSVIFRRQGLCAFEPEVYSDVDNMTLANYIIQAIEKYKPDAVFVDAGRGEGVIDRCRQLGYDIVEVNASSRSVKPNVYVNKRIEMWESCKEWLEAGGAIPNNLALKTELSTPTYFYDKKGRKQLESKDAIKERMGKSPDVADALVLTFAYPVMPRDRRQRTSHTVNTDYNPF